MDYLGLERKKVRACSDPGFVQPSISAVVISRSGDKYEKIKHT